MKRQILSFFLLSMVSFSIIFSSCSEKKENDEEGGIPEVPTTGIELDEQTAANFNVGFNFDASDSWGNISFVAHEPWTIEVAKTRNGEEWCVVSPSEGGPGQVGVSIKVKKNETFDDRSVSLTLRAGNFRKTMKVSQKCGEALIVSSNSFEVEPAGKTIDVEVKSNIEYTVSIDETCTDWIKRVEPETRAVESKKLSFIVAPSEEPEKRQGKIYIESKNATETINVYQASGGVIMLTQDEYAVSDEGGIISVELKSNLEYGVRMPSYNWIEEIKDTRAMSSHTIRYEVKPNNGYDPREAEIIYYNVYNEKQADTLRVRQAQRDAIILSKKNFTAKVEGGIAEIELKSNIDFEVKMPKADWVKKAPDTRGLSSHKLRYTIDKNDTYEAREAEIIFYKKDETQLADTFKIRQEYSEVIFLTEKYREVEPKGGEIEIEVNANTYYSLDISSKWITQVKDTRALTNDKIRLRIQESEYEDRTGIVVFRSSKVIRDTLTIFQRKFDNKLKLHVSQPGTLSGLIPAQDRLYVTDLTLTGELNNLDQKYLTELGGYGTTGRLSVLDLSGARVVNNEITIKGPAFTSVILPPDITAIGADAFSSSERLSSIAIPDKVEIIKSKAFWGCDSLASVALGKNLKTIEEYAFFYCEKLATVNFPDALETIMYSAFEGTAIKDVSFGSKLVSFAGDSFGASLKSITVSSNNPNYTSIDGVLFNKDKTTLVKYPSAKAGASYQIPTTVNLLGDYSFLSCSSLASVDIPSSVTKIGNNVFGGCPKLSNVVLGDHITEIGYYSFYACSGLKSITISSNIDFLPSGMLASCKYLEEIHLKGTTPPTIGGPRNEFAVSALSKVNRASCKVYIPKGSYAAYWQTKWNEFSTIIEE